MRINTRLAERLKKINPSSTLALTSKAKRLKSEGKDIISLAAGEPDFDTPDFIKDAGILAIKSGFTKYTPTTGTPDLKRVISEKFKKDNLLEYRPEQIVVSCGAKHSIFNALMVLLDRGDEVLIPNPYWVSYPEMVNLCEATPCFIKTQKINNFKLTAEDIETYSGRKTKLLILNSPANPTGSVYSQDELKAIAQICAKKKIFVLSDEIYEKIIYDNLRHVSIGSLGSDIYDLTITVNGVSKSYSMTGWRIGYLGAPADISESISKLQDHSTSCPSSISQKAALAALSSPGEVTKQMCLEFQARRDHIMARLSRMPALSFIVPQGAFYIFCDITKTKLDSATFANRLLEETGVVVIPGGAFGRDDYVRMSFATSIDQIDKSIDKLEAWLKKI
ncbi:MAG: pyridoxal phosphate-dependent aminotransferase [Candidatus Omnitrophica bacterium]|nr:pyridoxal phosphate-dependent aminotransferase [Candidatus Omnitrophota bacterium]